MSYGTLDIDVVFNFSALNTQLQQAENTIKNRLDQAIKPLQIQLRANTALAAISEVSTALRNIGQTTARIDVAVNGVPVAITQTKAVKAAIDATADASRKAADAAQKAAERQARLDQQILTIKDKLLKVGLGTEFEKLGDITWKNLNQQKLAVQQLISEESELQNVLKGNAAAQDRSNTENIQGLRKLGGATQEQRKLAVEWTKDIEGVGRAMQKVSSQATSSYVQHTPSLGLSAKVLADRALAASLAPQQGPSIALSSNVMGQRAAKAAADDLATYSKNLQIAAANSRTFNTAQAQSYKLLDAGTAYNNKYAIASQKMQDVQNAAGGAFRRGARDAGYFHESLLNVMNTIRRFVVGYLAVRGLIFIFQQLKESTIDYNSVLQRTTISLTQMLGGNQNQAEAFLTTLQQFGVVTPYIFRDLVQLVPQLKLAGVAISDMTLTLRALGDMSVASGKDINENTARIASEFLTMANKGKITGVELKALGTEGVPAVLYLARAFGDVLPKNLDQAQAKVREWIHQGIIPAGIAMKAIAVEAERDPLRAGQMERQAKSLSVALSNIIDGLNRAIGTAFKPAFTALNEQALRFAALLTSPSFQKWATETGTKIWAALIAIGGALRIAVQYWPVMVAGLSFMTAPKIAAGLAAVTLGFNVWAIAVLALVAAYQKFPAVRTIIDAVVETQLQGLKTLSWSINKFIGETSALFNRVPDALLGPVGVLWKNVLGDQSGVEKESARQWDAMIAAYRAGKKTLDAAVSGTGGNNTIENWIKEGMAAAKKAFGDVPKALHLTLKDLMEQTGNANKKQIDTLNDQAKAYDLIAKAAEDSGRRQINALKGIQDTLTGLFESMQRRLLEQGIITDPLGPMIRRFEAQANLLNRFRTVAENTNAIVGEAQSKAADARRQVESLQGKDALLPEDMTGGAVAATVSRANGAIGGTLNYVASMLKDSGRNIGLQCGEAITHYLNQSGIRGTATSLDTARNAVRPNAAGNYPEGTIFHAVPEKGSRYSRGHYFLLHYTGEGPKIVESNFRAADTVSSDRLFNQIKEVMRVDRGGRVHAYLPPGAPVIYPGGAVSMRATDIPGAATAAQQKMFGVKPTAAANLFGGDIFSGALTGLTALPKQWGAAVADTEETTSRFAAQMALSSKSFQQWMKQWGLSIQDVRAIANQTDWLANNKRAMAQFAKDTADAIKKVKEERKTALEGVQATLSNQLAENAGLQEKLNLLQESTQFSKESIRQTDIARMATKAYEAEYAKLLRASVDPAIAAARAKEVRDAVVAGENLKDATDRYSDALAYNTQSLKDAATAQEAYNKRMYDFWSGIRTAKVEDEAQIRSLREQLELVSLSGEAHESYTRSIEKANNARQEATVYQNAWNKAIAAGVGPTLALFTALAALSRAQGISTLKQSVKDAEIDARRFSEALDLEAETAKRMWEDQQSYLDKFDSDVARRKEISGEIGDRARFRLLPEGVDKEVARVTLQWSRLNSAVDATKPLFDSVQLAAMAAAFRIDYLAEQSTQRWNQFASDISNVFVSAITANGNFVQNMLKNTADYFQQVAAQLASNWLISQILGLAGVPFQQPALGGLAGILMGGGSSKAQVTPLAGGPSYASGIDYVPHDQWAYLHKNERVVPASQNVSYESGGITVINHFHGPVTDLRAVERATESGVRKALNRPSQVSASKQLATASDFGRRNQ